MTHAKAGEIAWDLLPPLPASAGQSKQPGLAGPFAGVHHDALIVAGGANFPERPPWEGGAKAWWPDIFVLEKLSGAQPEWVRDRAFKLPRPLAYGVSFSTPDGVVCAGGSDAERCYADVFLLAWDPEARAIRRTALPALPQPLAFMAGAMAGHTLYVAGGQHGMQGAAASAAFWSLDLAQRNSPQFGWAVLPGWPGPPRVLPVAAAQAGARGDAFYLFSGRVPHAGAATELLVDAWAFDSAQRRWRALPKVGGGAGVSVMAATAVASDEGEILVFGGDRGDLFLQLERHDLAIAAARQELVVASAAARGAIEAQIEHHLRAKKAIYAEHPGFSRDVLAFDPRAATWRRVTRASGPLPVTTMAVPFGRSVLLPSGEIRPGIRTPAVVRATLGGR